MLYEINKSIQYNRRCKIVVKIIWNRIVVGYKG